jgi:hypothetical protein
MAKIDEHQYRIEQLERKMTGVQRQAGVQNARFEQTAKKQEQRIRNLEIKVAVEQGVPQKKVAEIFQLSAGRVNQIIKKVA